MNPICDTTCATPLKEILKRCNLPVGTGGMGAPILSALEKPGYLEGSTSTPCCDPLFKNSIHALILERYSTVFLAFKTNSMLAAGGDLVYTPQANATPMEFFRTGINGADVAIPDARSVQVGTPVAPIPGENAPFALTFAETNSTQDVNNTGSNADLVQEETQDFLAVGQSFEIERPFTVVASGAGFARAYPTFLYSGDVTYAERIVTSMLDGSSLRMARTIGGADKRTWRLGSLMDWPSYTGYFGSRSGVTPGQPIGNTFKEFLSPVVTRQKPKLTSLDRLRTFLDMPDAPTVVSSNAAVTVPAGNSFSDTQGLVWLPVKIKFFGVQFCDNELDGTQRDLADAVADLRAQLAQLASRGK